MTEDIDESFDLSDEHQDWGILGSLNGQTALKRGEKDFEPDGTNFQVSALEGSRQAMYLALTGKRSHSSKNHCTATWIAEVNLARVDITKGGHFMTMGRADSTGTLWLYPEEALYLVERGSLECFYPQGFQMSLQALYAYAINIPGELEKYQVYSYLRKVGFVVQRTRHDAHFIPQTTTAHPFSYLGRLYSSTLTLFFNQTSKNPLIHRSYDQIYQALWKNAPSRDPEPMKEPQDPYKVCFNVWKPGNNFKKSGPGPPDYQVAVVSARHERMPTYSATRSLISSAPTNAQYDKLPRMQKLKDGSKNVLLTVVDAGVISFFKISDVNFSEQKIYQSFGSKKKSSRAPKRGTSNAPKRT